MGIGVNRSEREAGFWSASSAEVYANYLNVPLCDLMSYERGQLCLDPYNVFCN
jgi:hypothetical protein